jgi:hypothetical protein
MKTERPLPHHAALVCLLLASFLPAKQSIAMPGFDTEIAKLCAQNNRSSPVFNTSACTSCHTTDDPANNGGNATLRANGLVYQAYLADQSPANLENTLNAYCMGAYYNLQYDSAEKSNTGVLPPAWNQTPADFQYSGSLEVYWLARLGGDRQSLVLSRENAALQSNPLPANFNLSTAPDNCWGHQMNFGLLTLDKKANLTITVEADASQGSGMIPGFALYRGWDSGPSSMRHDVIMFGDDNPLGTTGLTYLGQALGGHAGETAEKTFAGLEPGNYELFVTVGTNQSSGGAYILKLGTTPTTASLTVDKTGNGAVTSSPAGISCGSTCTASFDSGTLVTLTATANAGNRFTEWVGCPNVSGETCTVTLSQSLTVSANFEQVMHGLTVKTSGTGKVISGADISCGTGTPGLCKALFPKGSTVTLLSQGGTLTGWAGACSGNGSSCAVTMNSDQCVTATFSDGAAVSCDGSSDVQRYTLTVSGTGKGRVTGSIGGIDCGANCKAALDEGAEAVLTATPEQGYVFKGWSGACAGASPSCSLVLNSDKTAIAEFMPVLSVAVTGGGRVTSDDGAIDCGATCSAGFAGGTSVTLAAVPQTGFRLAGWSGCTGIEDNLCHVAMDAPVTVSAAFAALAANEPAVADGACGSANDTLADASALSDPKALCLTGAASSPALLPDGRFAWSCLGTGAATRSAKCYTLSANGKLNQPPINLIPGNSRVSAGGVVRQTIVGGRGKGAVRVLKSATPGVKCKLLRKGKKLKVKVGGAPGTCTLTLVKARDARFNAVESPPVIITVQP